MEIACSLVALAPLISGLAVLVCLSPHIPPYLIINLLFRMSDLLWTMSNCVALRGSMAVQAHI